MQVPSTPDDASVDGGISPKSSHAAMDTSLPPRAVKRKRSPSPGSVSYEPNPKHKAEKQAVEASKRSDDDATRTKSQMLRRTSRMSLSNTPHNFSPQSLSGDVSYSSPSTPVVRPVAIRDLLRTVVNESLHFGGRPDSAIATATSTGEIIEVRSRSSNGHASTKTVEWSADALVPSEILVDERDFTKLVSALLLNAMKFTEAGSVRLEARLSKHSRFLVANISDTGSGIPRSFQKELFKPFSREDDLLTRQKSEGLGLGLMVAKGVARRLGGDISLVRSEIAGPRRGSEFEVRVPLTPFDDSTRPRTPSQTPTPHPLDSPKSPGLPDLVAEIADLKSPTQAPEAWERLGADKSPPLPRPPTTAPLPPGQPDTHTAVFSQRRGSVDRPGAFNKRLSHTNPHRFLVAEDNRINRKLLVTMLSKLGYTGTQEAFDGTEAVRLMEANWRAPDADHVDVILMDVWMPNMDGHEAAERILAMERQWAATGKWKGKRVKILAVTADVTDGALERARAAGMEGMMTKPYKMRDLERLIVEHCPPVVAEA